MFAASGRLLLLDQFPFLVGATIGSPLIHLRAGGRARARVLEHQVAVAVEKREAAVAVLHRPPLVVAGRAEIPLDNAGTLGSRRALDDGVLAAPDAVDAVIAAVGGNEPPAQIVAADRLPLGNGGTVGQAALLVQDQPAGFILELINRGRVQVDGGNAAGEEPHAAPEAARAR